MAEKKGYEKDFEERAEDFGEEMEKIGKKIEEKMDKGEEKGKTWFHRTFGILGPLLSSLVGIIFLGLGLVFIEMVNSVLNSTFLFNLHQFFLSNLGTIFFILLVFSYGSYLEKYRKRLHKPISPVLASFGITMFLWILSNIFAFINITIGNISFVGISIFLTENLWDIFLIVTVFGYLFLFVKEASGNPRKTKREKETKRLYRSGEEKVLGGVCGGIAEYFKVDPVIIRFIWVFAVLALGFGLMLYIIAWIIIPRNPEHEW